MIFQPPQENTFPKRACRSRHSLWSRFISVFGQAAWSLPFLLVGATFRNVSVMGDTGHSFEPIGSQHLEFNLVKRFGLFINGVIFFWMETVEAEEAGGCWQEPRTSLVASNIDRGLAEWQRDGLCLTRKTALGLGQGFRISVSCFRAKRRGGGSPLP